MRRWSSPSRSRSWDCSCSPVPSRRSGSAFAFSIQVWAQRRVEPARASIINLLEPVVAGFVGYAVGERLGWSGYLGAAIVLVGILVAEVGARRTEARDAAL